MALESFSVKKLHAALYLGKDPLFGPTMMDFGEAVAQKVPQIVVSLDLLKLLFHPDLEKQYKALSTRNIVGLKEAYLYAKQNQQHLFDHYDLHLHKSGKFVVLNLKEEGSLSHFESLPNFRVIENKEALLNLKTVSHPLRSKNC